MKNGFMFYPIQLELSLILTLFSLTHVYNLMNNDVAKSRRIARKLNEDGMRK